MRAQVPQRKLSQQTDDVRIISAINAAKRKQEFFPAGKFMTAHLFLFFCNRCKYPSKTLRSKYWFL